jgi:hypothetical protein
VQTETSLLDSVSRTLLTYLGKVPSSLAHSGELTPAQTRRLLAGLALDWGNCLLWIQPHLESDGPRHEQPLHEAPQSVHALGKQFRAVGLQLWDSPPAEQSDMERIVTALNNMSRAVDRLQASTAFNAMHVACDGSKDGAK